MSAWRPQPYLQQGRRLGIDPKILRNAVAVGRRTIAVNPTLPPIFTLRHLAHLTGINYALLRAIASRSIPDPYKVFRIRKRPANASEKRYRIICVPDPTLMFVQRWIAQRILSCGSPHEASVAYAKGNNIIAAAVPHCRCRWLIKLDVKNFFESISEIGVYRVFRSFGYEPLVSFELTRICTRLAPVTTLRRRRRWQASVESYPAISPYTQPRMGHLPQGAPTSPMLANLAVQAFDAAITDIADEHGMIYTRYADDIVLSTEDVHFSRNRAQSIIGKIYATMGKFGLSPNVTKTRVSSPGARKLVLGLLVDGPHPRLNREFKARLRQHLYYLTKERFGPSVHAAKRRFAAISGLRNHVEGLVAFARQVEPDYGRRCAQVLDKVKWPI